MYTNLSLLCCMNDRMAACPACPVMLQELSSTMGVLNLAARLNDPATQPWYDGIFPKDSQVRCVPLTWRQIVGRRKGHRKEGGTLSKDFWALKLTLFCSGGHEVAGQAAGRRLRII